jgi:hypothetical protein
VALAVALLTAWPAQPAHAHHGTAADCTGAGEECHPDGDAEASFTNTASDDCRFDADISWGDGTETHVSDFQDGQVEVHHYNGHGVFTIDVTGSATPADDCIFTGAHFTVEVPVPRPNPRGGYAVQPNTGKAFTLTPLGPEYPEAGPIVQTITTPKGDQIQLVQYDGKLVPAYIASVLLRAEQLGWKPVDGKHLDNGYRSVERQTDMYEACKQPACVKGKDVARPGNSAHEFGMAVDVNNGRQLDALAKKHKLPIWNGVAHEKWHFEPVGTRDGKPAKKRRAKPLLRKRAADSYCSPSGDYCMRALRREHHGAEFRLATFLNLKSVKLCASERVCTKAKRSRFRALFRSVVRRPGRRANQWSVRDPGLQKRRITLGPRLRP